eukprot:2488631-Pleurochrysis_carterae.AAC.4
MNKYAICVQPPNADGQKQWMFDMLSLALTGRTFSQNLPVFTYCAVGPAAATSPRCLRAACAQSLSEGRCAVLTARAPRCAAPGCAACRARLPYTVVLCCTPDQQRRRR